MVLTDKKIIRKVMGSYFNIDDAQWEDLEGDEYVECMLKALSIQRKEILEMIVRLEKEMVDVEPGFYGIRDYDWDNFKKQVEGK